MRQSFVNYKMGITGPTDLSNMYEQLFDHTPPQTDGMLDQTPVRVGKA